MTIPVPGSRPNDPVGATFRADVVDGMTLEQFRSVLRSSEAMRRHIGLDIGDQAAAAIAADEALSAGWLKLWRTSQRTTTPQVVKFTAGHANPNSDQPLPAEPPGQTATIPVDDNLRVLGHEPRRSSLPSAASVEEGDTGLTTGADWERQQAAWQRELPMRFNAPPGWSVPSQDWVSEHLGLPINQYRRPPGAPASDPIDWVWWIPQEPQWTAWMDEKRSFYRGMALLLGLVLVAIVGIAVLANDGGATIATVIFGIVPALGLVGTTIEYLHFRKDPMSGLRQKYVRAHE